MPEELLKTIENCHECLCGDCKYKYLQKQNNFVLCMDALMTDAANTIKELNNQLDQYHKYDGFLYAHGFLKELPKEEI